MKRRDFTAGLATSAIAGPVLANIREDGSNRFPSFAYMRFATRSRPIIPVRLVVISDNFAQEIGIGGKLPIFNQKSVGIFNRPMIRQFRGGVDVGDVGLVGKDIVVRTNLEMPPKKVFIADSEIGFRIDFDNAAKDVESTVPWIGDIPLIGKLFRKRNDRNAGDGALIRVTPQILTYSE